MSTAGTSPFALRRRHHHNTTQRVFDHIDAGIPLVRVGGIRGAADDSVREDWTHAHLSRAHAAGDHAPRLDDTLMGGEPYARWI